MPRCARTPRPAVCPSWSSPAVGRRLPGRPWPPGVTRCCPSLLGPALATIRDLLGRSRRSGRPSSYDAATAAGLDTLRRARRWRRRGRPCRPRGTRQDPEPLSPTEAMELLLDKLCDALRKTSGRSQDTHRCRRACYPLIERRSHVIRHVPHRERQHLRHRSSRSAFVSTASADCTYKGTPTAAIALPQSGTEQAGYEPALVYGHERQARRRRYRRLLEGEARVRRQRGHRRPVYVIDDGFAQWHSDGTRSLSRSSLLRLGTSVSGCGRRSDRRATRSITLDSPSTRMAYSSVWRRFARTSSSTGEGTASRATSQSINMTWREPS